MRLTFSTLSGAQKIPGCLGLPPTSSLTTQGAHALLGAERGTRVVDGMTENGQERVQGGFLQEVTPATVAFPLPIPDQLSFSTAGPSPILWGICLHLAPLLSQKMGPDDPKLLTLVIGSEMGQGPGQAAQRKSPRSSSACARCARKLLSHFGARRLLLTPPPGS